MRMVEVMQGRNGENRGETIVRQIARGTGCCCIGQRCGEGSTTWTSIEGADVRFQGRGKRKLVSDVNLSL